MCIALPFYWVSIFILGEGLRRKTLSQSPLSPGPGPDSRLTPASPQQNFDRNFTRAGAIKISVTMLELEKFHKISMKADD